MYDSYTTSSSVIPIEVLFCKIIKQTLTRKVVLNKIWACFQVIITQCLTFVFFAWMLRVIVFTEPSGEIHMFLSVFSI